MANVGATGPSAMAEHQPFDGTWGKVLIALAIIALILVLAGITSMVWHMEKKRCKPEDCEKCGVGGEDRDGTLEDATTNNVSVVCKQR